MNNCAFQFAITERGFMGRTRILEDQCELTLEEAKVLWNKHYPNAARRMKAGDEVEMALWINMKDSSHYKDTLYYIRPHFESDGETIWEVKKEAMPSTLS